VEGVQSENKLVVVARVQLATSIEQLCRYCGRYHEANKESCGAYLKTCSKCGKRNQYFSICPSRQAIPAPRQQHMHKIDAEESLLTLDDDGRKRIYSDLYVGNNKGRFLLHCGSTVNILPRSIAHKLRPGRDFRPPRATLRMFDTTVVPTVRVTTASETSPHAS